MQTAAEGTRFTAESIDQGLDRLLQDLLDAPRDVVVDANFGRPLHLVLLEPQ